MRRREMLSGNTYKASVSGYVKTLYIKEGDKVSNGTKLADIYDDSVMKLTVPFLSAEAGADPGGKSGSADSGGYGRGAPGNRDGGQQYGGDAFRGPPGKGCDRGGGKPRRSYNSGTGCGSCGRGFQL